MTKSSWEIELQRLQNLLASVSSYSEADETKITDDNFLKDNEHFAERFDQLGIRTRI